MAHILSISNSLKLLIFILYLRQLAMQLFSVHNIKTSVLEILPIIIEGIFFLLRRGQQLLPHPLHPVDPLVEHQFKVVLLGGVLVVVLELRLVAERRGEERVEADPAQGGTYWKVFSMKRGMILLRTGQVVSRQGLVLISISQTSQLASIMKSSPNTSKLFTRFSGSMLSAEAWMALVAMRFIFGYTPSKKLKFESVFLTKASSSSQVILLPFSKRPQSGRFFWTASLVRWTEPELISSVYSELVVRTQPWRYQQPFILPLTQLSMTQWRMSNLRRRQRSGRSMYFCRMQVLQLPSPCFSFRFRIALISFRSRHTMIPLPRLVFSPGLTIQALNLLSESGFALLPFAIEQKCCRNLRYWSSSSPFLMWKVSGRQSKTSCPLLLQYSAIVWNSAFLLPIRKLLAKWLCTFSRPRNSPTGCSTTPSSLPRCLRCSFMLRSFSMCRAQQLLHLQFSCALNRLKPRPAAAFFPTPPSDAGSSSPAITTTGSPLFCAWKTPGFLICVHTNCASCTLSVSWNQGLRFMMPLMRLELLPGPTKYFTLLSYSSTASTTNSFEKATRHRKSRQQYSSKGGLNLAGFRTKTFSARCRTGESAMMDLRRGSGCIPFSSSGLLQASRLLWLQFLSMRILLESSDSSISLIEIFSTDRQSLMLLESFGRSGTSASCTFFFLLLLRRNCVCNGIPRPRLNPSATVLISSCGEVTLGRLHFWSIWTTSRPRSSEERSMEADRWYSACLPTDLTSNWSCCCRVSFSMWRYICSNFSRITMQPMDSGMASPLPAHPLSFFLRGRSEKDLIASRLGSPCFSLSLLRMLPLSVMGIKLQARWQQIKSNKPNLPFQAPLPVRPREIAPLRRRFILFLFKSILRATRRIDLIKYSHHNMKLLITLVLCLCLQAEPAHRYRDSLALWQKKVPKEAAFSLKQFSNEKEMCGEAPCELFYFLAQNPQIANQKHANLTVLLLGGLRGDDTTGPNLLLNAYGQLPAARTVFFPLPNPSGFNQGTLPTHPGGISVEDDLPVGENHECNRTAAVMALHYLYRSYPIDLTIYVHDGKPAIAYSWGKKYQEDSAKAEDFGIYADIADMVRFEGSDQSGLGQIEAGSLFEMAQLGRVGDFVDWAYGASKYPATLSKQCGGKDVAAYPPLMMNGLVLSLGVGKIQATANPLPVAEKQLKRGLLLIEKIVRITSPKAKLEIDSRTIFLTLEGCKTGSVSSIKLLKEGGEPLFQRSGETIVNGDVTYGPPEAKTFPLPKETVIPSGANYQVAFDCGDGWLNIGSTAFSKPRSFTQKGFIINKQQKQQTQTVIAHSEQQQQKQQHQKQEKQQQKTVESKGEIKGEDKSGDVREGESEWGAFQFLGITLLLVGGGWMVNGIRLGLKAQRSQRIKNFNQKFETVEIVEDLESYSEGLDEKETPEQGEHGELKESQQDADKARLRSA